MGGLRRQFLEGELITTTSRSTSVVGETKKDNVKKWISFF